MCAGIFNFLMATDTASYQAEVNKAKTADRDATNAKNAAQSDLARFSQALGNNKILKAAGDKYAALTTNLFRNLDNASVSKTMRGLQVSERLGAATAAAASSGIGGSSVEMYNKTIQTAAALQEGLADRNVKYGIYDANLQRGRVLPDAVDSFNKDVYVANMDYSYLGPTKAPSVFGELATLAVSTALTATGNPQAGEFVLRAKTASMQADYGDNAGATKSMDQAMTAFKGGVGEIKGWFSNSGSGSGVSSSFGNLDDVGSVTDNGISFG